jgi:hypothetical protein
MTNSFTMAEPDTHAQVSGGRYTITGLLAQGPVLGSTLGGLDPSNVLVHLEWINTTSSRRKAILYRVRMWEASPTVEVVNSVTTDTDIAAIRRASFMHSYRSAASGTATDAGVPGAVVSWFSGAGATAKWWFMFPPPASATTLGKTDISTTLDVEPTVSHQGRSIGYDAVAYGNGGAAIVWTVNEQSWYTNSNLLTLQNTTADTFGQEDPTGIAVALSMTANELFIVKRRNGGFVIRGDISDPTVLRLPGVTGAGGATQTAVSAPIGAVYGVVNGGVWVWAGGEESQLLSPNLNQDMLTGMTGQDIFNGGHLGRFESAREWIFAANNWVYDWRQKSWWRIDDPTDRAILHWCNAVQVAGVFGTPVYMEDATTPYLFFYDFTSPARDYSWQSQPLPQTTQQDIEVRHIVVVAEGAAASTVTVTLKGLSGVLSDPAVFTLGSTTYLDMQRQSTTLNASHVQVHIEADGGANPAPIVHEVRIGYHSTTSLPNEANPSV